MIRPLASRVIRAYTVIQRLQETRHEYSDISQASGLISAEKLDAIADATDRPRSYIIQQALESYIEDYADLQIALDRLHDKTDAVISGKALRKSLGL